MSSFPGRCATIRRWTRSSPRAVTQGAPKRSRRCSEASTTNVSSFGASAGRMLCLLLPTLLARRLVVVHLLALHGREAARSLRALLVEGHRLGLGYRRGGGRHAQ